jgi:hypothetical protein
MGHVPESPLPSEQDGLARLFDARTARLQMRGCHAASNFVGALELANIVLAHDPDDVEADLVRASSCEFLLQVHSLNAGSRAKIPRVALAGEFHWLGLNHRAGFLLSCIDGKSSVEDILDVSGMSQIEAVRVLCSLLEQEVIEFLL